MKTKVWNKLAGIVLFTAVLIMTMILAPANVLAGPQRAASKDLTGRESSAQTISEFLPLDESEKSLTITSKLSLDELTAKMPEQIGVTLSDGTEENIDVTWESVGDYEKTDYFYYEFDPVLPEEYSIQKELELPYISVFLRPSSDKGPQIRRLRGNSNEEQVYNFLREDMGLNTAGACGILANINAESGFNPHATGDGGTSYGICQWHNSRWTNLKNYCSSNGYDWTTLDGQLHYLKYESERSYRSTLNTVKSVADTADGAYNAAYAWCKHFEVPANTEAVSQSRGRVARDTYWPKYRTVNNPVGCIDAVWGGLYKVHVSGWAYDLDDLSASISIHVYVGDRLIAGITANHERRDVNATYPYHGFDDDISVPKDLTGTQTVAIYGINIGGTGSNALLGTRTVEIQADTTSPVVSNVQVTDIDPTGYTVSCTVTDESGIDRVMFPTWTALNGQDDLVQDWGTNELCQGKRSGDTYTYRVKVSEHNHESGQYITHIYAWDQNGNYAWAGVPAVEVPLPEDKRPSITSVSIYPASATIVRGGRLQLTAEVKGKNDADTAVTWQVSGNSSSNTTISAKGVLKVGGDEKSSALKVTAVSKFDSSKSASAAVGVRMFKDVFLGQFFYDAANWGAANSVISGYVEGDGTYAFKPNDVCTRAQFVTFLWREMGMQSPKSTENPFTDIADIRQVYFSNAVLWAYENGYVAGYSDPNGVRFGADDEVTRGQVVTFLWRAAGSPKASSASSPFKDVKDPSSQYYGEAMLWAAENGVVSGYPDGNGARFAANDNCTRGQVVTFLWRYAQKFSN